MILVIIAQVIVGMVIKEDADVKMMMNIPLLESTPVLQKEAVTVTIVAAEEEVLVEGVLLAPVPVFLAHVPVPALEEAELAVKSLTISVRSAR